MQTVMSQIARDLNQMNFILKTNSRLSKSSFKDLESRRPSNWILFKFWLIFLIDCKSTDEWTNQDATIDDEVRKGSRSQMRSELNENHLENQRVDFIYFTCKIFQHNFNLLSCPFFVKIWMYPFLHSLIRRCTIPQQSLNLTSLRSRWIHLQCKFCIENKKKNDFG